jgi:hypothetical protein
MDGKIVVDPSLTFDEYNQSTSLTILFLIISFNIPNPDTNGDKEDPLIIDIYSLSDIYLSLE